MSKIVIAARFRCYFGEKSYLRNSDKLLTRYEDVDMINMSNIKSFINNYKTVGYHSIECIDSFGLDNTKKIDVNNTELKEYTVEYFNQLISLTSKDAEVVSPEIENKILNEKLKVQEETIKELQEKMNLILNNQEKQDENHRKKSKKSKNEVVENTMTKEEVIKQLDEKGIDYDIDADIDELIELLKNN